MLRCIGASIADSRQAGSVRSQVSPPQYRPACIFLPRPHGDGAPGRVPFAFDEHRSFASWVSNPLDGPAASVLGEPLARISLLRGRAGRGLSMELQARPLGAHRDHVLLRAVEPGQWRARGRGDTLPAFPVEAKDNPVPSSEPDVAGGCPPQRDLPRFAGGHRP